MIDHHKSATAALSALTLDEYERALPQPQPIAIQTQSGFLSLLGDRFDCSHSVLQHANGLVEIRNRIYSYCNENVDTASH
jgi:hypothetical protein